MNAGALNMPETFTPVASLGGGVLIGLASALLWLGAGRIAGISGIAGELIAPRKDDAAWRVAFLAGLLAAGAIATLVAPDAFESTITRSPAAVAVAGLLVGFGTRLGNGCTSGHGVCGISRGAPRSITATLVFMAAAGATVFFIERALGGAV